MASYEASLVDDDDRQNDFSEVLAETLDPLVSVCLKGDASGKLGRLENSVYITNCLFFIRNKSAIE